MSQLIDNLNLIVSIKSDIKSAIENKGVDMTGVSFPGYASKIGEISGGGQFITEPLNVTSNGTYTPGQGVDGFSTVTVDVPQSVTGFTEKEITEGVQIVNLSNSASFVGDYAFIYNNHLTTVNLPMCSSVGSFAFSACNSLISISLPVCTYVGGYTFQYCNNLSSVNFLPMCSSVGSFAFAGCSSLRTVDLPVCTYVGGYTFQNCNKLSSVNLPMCSVVNTWTFYRCISLSIIDLPMCSNISQYGFYYCSSLQELTIGNEISTVCVLKNSNAFDGCSALTSIYVPASLVESYKAATNWTYFSDKIVGI